MIVDLNFKRSYDVYELFRLLNNEKTRLQHENCDHFDMIKLLEGNETNEKAKNRLGYEKDCVRKNNEHIEFLNGLLDQLEPMVDKCLKE